MERKSLGIFQRNEKKMECEKVFFCLFCLLFFCEVISFKK